MNVLNQLIDSAQRWAMYQGDCVETLRGIPDNSIHYSIFFPAVCQPVHLLQF